MTKKEFIELAFKPYIDDSNKRALEGSACMYRTNDGRKCVIGQFIPDSLYTPNMEGSGIHDNILCALPENIRQLDIDFLCKCQSIHDDPVLWAEYPETKEEIIFKLSQLAGELVNFK